MCSQNELNCVANISSCSVTRSSIFHHLVPALPKGHQLIALSHEQRLRHPFQNLRWFLIKLYDLVVFQQQYAL